MSLKLYKVVYHCDIYRYKHFNATSDIVTNKIKLILVVLKKFDWF